MPTSECAYCGIVAEATDDHIPPKTFFTGSPDLPLRSVKACLACNTGASLDDEYFRDTVVKYHRVGDLPQAQILVGKMLRAMAHPKKTAYAQATFDAIVDVDVTMPSGIHLGKHPAFVVDQPRLDRAVTRYARGLHRYHFGERVPANTPTIAVVNPDAVSETAGDFIASFQGAELFTIQSGVFWYACRRFAERPDASYWLMVFFDVFPVLAAIRPELPPSRQVAV